MSIDKNSRVTLNFSLNLLDGHLIDSNFDNEPVTFDMGDGSLLVGFEQSLMGLTAGQTQCVTIEAKNAFGLFNQENEQSFKRSDFAGLLGDPPVELTKGLVVSFADAAGNELPGVVKSFADDNVTVDFNHPLAGRDIIFEVKIVEVGQTR